MLGKSVISIIPADGKIIVNGEARDVDFSGSRVENIHAIQWNGTSGNIEFKQGPAQFFDNFLMVADIAELYETAVIQPEAPEPLPEGGENGGAE